VIEADPRENPVDFLESALNVRDGRGPAGAYQALRLIGDHEPVSTGRKGVWGQEFQGLAYIAVETLGALAGAFSIFFTATEDHPEPTFKRVGNLQTHSFVVRRRVT
jgi:hypothetical protein